MPTLQQLLAASALIATIERQCLDGIHSETEEMRLRELSARACKAFGFDSIAEREYNNIVNIVELEMKAPA